MARQLKNSIKAVRSLTWALRPGVSSFLQLQVISMVSLLGPYVLNKSFGSFRLTWIFLKNVIQASIEKRTQRLVAQLWKLQLRQQEPSLNMSADGSTSNYLLHRKKWLSLESEQNESWIRSSHRATDRASLKQFAFSNVVRKITSKCFP